MSWYKEGTISVTNGGTSIIGVDTQFLREVARGGILLLENHLYEIDEVISDTALELNQPIQTATAAGLSYAIIRNITNASNVPLIRRIDEFLTDRQRSMEEFVDWVNGTHLGGPNGDGKYPLTDRYGVVTLVKSPARIGYEAGGPGFPGVPGAGSGDFRKMNVFVASDYGVMGGLTVDESEHLAAAIAACGQAGGGKVLVRSHNGIDPIYINSQVSIDYDNVELVFESTLAFGANGWIRISGGLAETLRPGQSQMAKLRADAYTDAEGRMVLPVSTGSGAFISPGDRLTIRGQNAADGRTLEKQIAVVHSVDGDNITMADEPDYNFKAVYPDSDYADDLTTGTTIAIGVYTALTTNTSNTDILPVHNASAFAVGDLVYVSDLRTEADMMAPVVTNLKNAANMEIARISKIEPGKIFLERALRRSYLTSFSAGVAKMKPIRNSHIIVNSMYWVARQPSRKNAALAINYGDGCTIRVQRMEGLAGRLGIGVRIAYAYDCHAIDCKVYNAAGFLSGEAYGIALYYSTLCTIRNCIASGNRHNFLLQTTTSCDILDNVSNDDYISGIDLHGAGSVDTRVMRNRVSRSRNYADGVTNGGGIRNGNTSHTIGDHNTLIADNYIEGYLDDKCAAIDVSPSSLNCVIRDNTIIDCRIGVRHYKVGSSISPAQRADRITIDSNTFTRVGQLLDIDNYANSFWDEVLLLNNKSVENSQHFAIKKVSKVTAIGNQVHSPMAASGAYAFDFDGVTDLRAYQNYAGKTARGIQVRNCSYAKVVRNQLSDVTEGVLVNDGGGNGTLINLQNTDDLPAAGGSAPTQTVGSAPRLRKFTASLPVDTTSSLTVPLNSSTPSVNNGLTAMDVTVEGTVGNVMEITACIPYVSMGGSSGPCIAHLFADNVRIGTFITRLTASASAVNSGGSSITIQASLSISSPTTNLKLQIGPTDGANQILLNNRYSGATQPYMLIKEFSA